MEDEPGFWRRLAYAWFVENNPLYLLSAALVLGGSILVLRDLSVKDDTGATLGVAVVNEVYAFSLLGGAALLTRIGPRRPAVMLALLFVLYQWDLTLHTEICPLLGPVGTAASVAWVAIFIAKIYALEWALRVRFARTFIAAASLGAIGLAVAPHILAELPRRSSGALLAVWVFALGALRRPSGEVTSLVGLTPWGETVLRRTTRAAWILSTMLVGFHVLVWADNHPLGLGSLAPVAPLLFVRRIRSEARMWMVVLGTLAVARVLPESFSTTAFLAAGALVLRALSPTFRPAERTAPPAPARQQPYRTSGAPVDANTNAPAAPEPSSVVERDERIRSFVGAFFALHLSAWTLHGVHGAWPAHVAGLDAALTLGALLAVWRLRIRSPLLPLAACYIHLVLQEHLVPAPRSHAAWGAASIALGFVVLAGSLVASYLLRLRPASAPSGGASAAASSQSDARLARSD